MEVKHILHRGPWTSGRLVFNTFSGYADTAIYPVYFRELFLEHETAALPYLTDINEAMSSDIYDGTRRIVDFMRGEVDRYILKFAKIVMVTDMVDILTETETPIYILHMDNRVVTEDDVVTLHHEIENSKMSSTIIDTSAVDGEDPQYPPDIDAIIVPSRKSIVSQYMAIIRPLLEYMRREAILEIENSNPVRAVGASVKKSLDYMRMPRGMAADNSKKRRKTGDVMYG